MSNLRQQILAKTLPPIIPSSSRKASTDATKKSPVATRNYTPVEWTSYFDDKRILTIDQNRFCIYTRHANDPLLPILFFLHGGGFSGLSWAVLSKAITSLVRCQCVAIDIRGHGDTHTTNDHDLNIEILTNDVCQIIHHLYKEDDKPPIFLIGHSMGKSFLIDYSYFTVIDSYL